MIFLKFPPYMAPAFSSDALVEMPKRYLKIIVSSFQFCSVDRMDSNIPSLAAIMSIEILGQSTFASECRVLKWQGEHKLLSLSNTTCTTRECERQNTHIGTFLEIREKYTLTYLFAGGPFLCQTFP